jgi:3-methylcrotonyl-CoA carboxylase beta subunit
MPRLDSNINRKDADFMARAEHHRQLADDLRQKLAQTALGGPERSRQKHLDRGKLLPRERVRTLLDSGSPFLEISPLAANGLYDGDAPGAGIIAGIGRVEGVECMVVANDATVKGGTYYPMTVKKHLAPRKSPSRTICPASTWWTQVVPSCRCRTRSFRIATTSAASSTTRHGYRPGIPQIAVVMGSCTAGGAYVPAMSDEAIIVKDQGTIFLGRPAAGAGRHRRRSRAPRTWAAPTPTPACPAWPTISPKTTSTRWPSPASSWPTSPTHPGCTRAS